TVYNDLKSTENITVIHNDYSYYKEEFVGKTVGNYTLFLGSPFSDLDKMSTEDYLDLLYKIQQKYNDLKIIYIPHRYEEDQTLKKIESLGYIVKKLNTSIEYELLTEVLSIP